MGFRHGGGDALTQRGEEYVATIVAQEADFARGLAEGIEDGSVSLKQGLARARQYANRVRGTANEAFREASLGGDYTLNWVQTAKDPCADCPQLEALSPWFPQGLFQVPGDGQTPCRSNCKCFLVRSDGREGFKPVDFSL